MKKKLVKVQPKPVKKTKVLVKKTGVRGIVAPASTIQHVKEIDLFVSTFDHLQKGRIRVGNRLGALERDGYDKARLNVLHDFLDIRLELMEKDIDKAVCEFVKDHPLWTQWLEKVKGIGLHMAGLILYAVRDVRRFETISKFWAYYGFIPVYYKAECEHGHKHFFSSDPLPAGKTCQVLDGEDEVCGGKFISSEKVENQMPHRAKGFHFNFNMTGRKIFWMCSEQLIKSNGIYKRMIYDKYKEIDSKEHPDFPAHRLHTRARRKIIKLFMSHVWEVLRQSEKLPAIKPYTVVFQNEEYIPPLVDK